MKHAVKLIMTGSIIALTTAAASAGTITATFDTSHSKSINIDADGHYNGDVTTVQFNWTRADAPGPGVDALVPITFDSYCIDLDQSLPNNGNVVFNVMTPQDYGLSALQITLLGRLWGSYFPAVSSKTTSAAFQAAVWEIRYDTDLTLAGGSFKQNNQSSIRALAQSWIDAIVSPDFSGVTAPLYVLQSNTAQDQLVAVPSAGSAPLLAIAGLLVIPRRRPGSTPARG